IFSVHAGGDGQELGGTVKGAKLVGDAGDAVGAEFLRFDDHALIGFEPAVVDDLRDLRYFAAEEEAAGGGEGAQETHGENGVSDDEFSRGEVLEMEAVDFVAGQ